MLSCTEKIKWFVTPFIDTHPIPDKNIISLSNLDILPKWPKKQKIAILLHGLACTYKFMLNFSKHIENKYDKIVFIAYDWRNSLEENSQNLSQILYRIAPKTKSIDIHGYSNGGVIARQAIYNCSDVSQIKKLITYHAPHLGSHLAHLANSSFLKTISWLWPTLAHWQCDGARDLIPNSPALNKLQEQPLLKNVKYTFLAGNDGDNFLYGITQHLFDKTNDGVATVESQLNGNHKQQIIMPWNHLTMLYQQVKLDVIDHL
jgi:hypothetical protein